MEPHLPKDLYDLRSRPGRGAEWVVRGGPHEHRCHRLTEKGFEIEADGRPPLRGFVDLLRGGERVARLLVVCSWARHGRVGYEVKRGSLGGLGNGD